MKVLGIVFGAPGGICDMLLEHALKAAEKEGAATAKIQIQNHSIGHCTGCGQCIRNRELGESLRCVIQDDFVEIEEAILDADGLVLVVPVYGNSLCGQFRNLADRYNTAKELASILEEQKRRVQKHMPSLLDERLLRKKYVASIAVSGELAEKDHGLALQELYRFAAKSCMIPVGQFWTEGMEKERAGQLGEHLVSSYGRERKEALWFGEKGICPVCHGSIFEIQQNSQLTCLVCESRAQLNQRKKSLEMEFDPASMESAVGTMQHSYESHFAKQIKRSGY